MSGSKYPMELYHPCGFKTLTVYDAEELKAAQADFKAWKDEHLRDTRITERGGDMAAQGAKR